MNFYEKYKHLFEEEKPKESLYKTQDHANYPKDPASSSYQYREEYQSIPLPAFKMPPKYPKRHHATKKHEKNSLLPPKPKMRLHQHPHSHQYPTQHHQYPAHHHPHQHHPPQPTFDQPHKKIKRGIIKDSQASQPKYVSFLPKLVNDPRKEVVNGTSHVKLPSIDKTNPNPNPSPVINKIEGHHRRKLRPVKSQQEPRRKNFDKLFSKKPFPYNIFDREENQKVKYSPNVKKIKAIDNEKIRNKCKNELSQLNFGAQNDLSPTDDIIKTLVYNKKEKDTSRGLQKAVEKRIMSKKILVHRRNELKHMLKNVEMFY
ncbi:unnamed protein product [Moneuplotes crassus]|uniref:Uncharacterized protein n=1 Tax=Euplotes crassus TaxID=5936 RepID=A0AAD1XGH6_EUPCR|nr:unnamed protein product [Moneuplotes crassus]